MKATILPSAREDLVDAYWFYEGRESGVGDYFIQSILADIESLEKIRGYSPIHLHKHRMIATKFPYSIYYLVENKQIHIYAVLDNRRDPEWTSDRLN